MIKFGKVFGCFMLMITMLCCAASAFAAEAPGFEEISIDFPGAPSYIQDQSDAYFTVEIRILGGDDRVYDICYSTDGFSTTYKDSISIKAGRYIKKKISLAGLSKGAYDMSVKVMDGDRVAAEKTLGMGIVEFYVPRALDSYSRIGITAGMTQTGGYEIRDLASNQADLLKKCGLFNIRYSGAGTWVSVEKIPGVYNFIGTNIYRDYFEDMNNLEFVGGSRGIDLYKDPNSETAPRTVEQMDALMNFVREKFDHYPIENSHRTTYAIWNEPNLQNYWPKNPSAYEYSVMQRLLALESKERYPDMPVIALDIANGTDAIEYIHKMFNTDVYPYIDGYSFHPYSFPRDIDTSYEPLIGKFLDLEDEYGGWMDCYITETGYPTPKSTQGVSEEVQAENIVKALAYNDKHEIDGTYFYSFKDNGPSETDRESNFGIVDYDWSPKAGYVAMAQTTKMLNTAHYVGETDLGANINAYVYLRERKPMIIAWAPSDPVAFAANENWYIEDVNGNEIKEKSFELGKSPIYIHQVDYSVLKNTLAKTVSAKLTEFVEKWGAITDVSDIKALSDTETVNINIATPEEFANKLFAFGDKLIAEYDGTTYSIEQLGTMLDKLFKINRYIVLAMEDSSFAPKSHAAVKRVGASIEKIKGDEDAVLRISDKIYGQGKKYNFRVADSFDGSNAIIKGYDLLSVKLCAWAEKFAEKETVHNYAKIVTHSYPSYVDSFQAETETVKYTVMNEGKKTLNGYAVITDEKGEEVSRRYAMEVSGGNRMTQELSFSIPTDKPAGDYTYRISFMGNDEEISYLIFPVAVKPLFDVTLNSTNASFDELESVEMVIDCLYDGEADGIFEITPPEGWKFKNSVLDLKFDSKGQKVVKLEIEEKAKAKFNEYVIGIKVKKADGEILVEKKLPIDFNLIVKADKNVTPADYDGSLKDWENAYPVHIGTPAEPQMAEAWEESNIATRAFMKWSSSYLYILVDVYDDYHSNMFVGSGNWNGDNVQISIDSLCDKATAYQADDYEIGFSYASAGNDIWEYYNRENVQKVLSPDYMKVIRDNRYNITRYYIRLPLSEIEPTKLELNSKIGFNFGINDGDMVERERFIEYTLGTCTKKSPSLYKDFLFISNEEGGYQVDTGTYREEIQNDFTN